MWRILLPILLEYSPHHLDLETEVERAARMEVIARSVDYAASRATCSCAFQEWVECRPVYDGTREELGSMLVAVARSESYLALHVHEGRCGTNECDAVSRSGTIVHRARSLWQVHFHQDFAEEWENMPGVTLWSTSDAAWAASVVLAMGKRRCGTRLGALTAYLGHYGCSSPEGTARLLAAETVQRRLLSSGAESCGHDPR